jgi:hypothetical protein
MTPLSLSWSVRRLCLYRPYIFWLHCYPNIMTAQFFISHHSTHSVLFHLNKVHYHLSILPGFDTDLWYLWISTLYWPWPSAFRCFRWLSFRPKVSQFSESPSHETRFTICICAVHNHILINQWRRHALSWNAFVVWWFSWLSKTFSCCLIRLASASRFFCSLILLLPDEICCWMHFMVAWCVLLLLNGFCWPRRLNAVFGLYYWFGWFFLLDLLRFPLEIVSPFSELPWNKGTLSEVTMERNSPINRTFLAQEWTFSCLAINIILPCNCYCLARQRRFSYPFPIECSSSQSHHLS